MAYGAFASTASRGPTWSGGIGWAGRYILFVTDTATGTKITATPDIAPGTIPTIDLDAICFGFDTCNYLTGGPGTTAGSFHPTTPTRILDTRRGLGIWGRCAPATDVIPHLIRSPAATRLQTTICR